MTPLEQVLGVTRPVEAPDALRLVEGRTEKPGGVDPALLLAAGLGNGRGYVLGHVPLGLFRANEAGDRYDGTVDLARAHRYARRQAADAPPVIAVFSRDGLRLNIHDGGHRISAARLRGDRTLFALVAIRLALLLPAPARPAPLLASLPSFLPQPRPRP